MEIQRVGMKVEDQRDIVRGQDEWEDGVKMAPFVSRLWLLKRRLILRSELQRRKSEAYKQDYLSLFNKHTHTHTVL